MPLQEAREIPKRVSEPVTDLLVVGAHAGAKNEAATIEPTSSGGLKQP